MQNIHGFTPPHELSALPPNTPMLVAFSGGADSSVLLRLAVQYACESGAAVYAAHLNHMIRGEEANRDEEFCRDVCERLGVRFFSRKADIPALAKARSLSVETAAREARYEFFDSLMEEYSIPLLLTAHNANDNLETQIFNIVRGCGLRGVCGIPRSRRCKYGQVLRPILGMSRTQILEYCSENSISYVTDSTNADTDYTRNKIRAEIIPALTSLNPSAISNASRLSDSLREDALCLESMADMFCESMNDDASFDLQLLLGSPRAVVNRALMSLYASMSGGEGLERVHLDAILSLCRGGVAHSSVSLPRGIDAKIENGTLIMCERKATCVPCETYSVTLCEGENTIPQINASIFMGNSQSAKNIYKTAIPMYLDFDKINTAFYARERRPSDRIRYNGVNKSVKKLLCDLHIPLDVRYRLPMLCVGEEIAAIPLVGVSDRFRVKNSEHGNALYFTLL